MATIRISVLIDTVNDIDDLNDIKGDLLTIVSKIAIKKPDKFLLKKLVFYEKNTKCSIYVLSIPQRNVFCVSPIKSITLSITVAANSSNVFGFE